VHLVNLSHAGTWKAPVDELIEIGAQRLTVSLPGEAQARSAHLLVAGSDTSLETGDGGVTVTVPGVLDHEVVVIELS
jgi:hypothetical protein